MDTPASLSSKRIGCIGCGKCEQHCPQHLPIRQELKNAQKAMEGLPYKLGKLVLPHIMHY